jgi:hypothetical protein
MAATEEYRGNVAGMLIVPNPEDVMRSRDSAVSIAISYGAGRPRGQSSSPGRCKIFLLSTSPRPALGLT